MGVKRNRGDGDHMIGSWGKCWICHLPTRAIELNFETHIHRGLCSRIAWRRFERA